MNKKELKRKEKELEHKNITRRIYSALPHAGERMAKGSRRSHEPQIEISGNLGYGRIYDEWHCYGSHGWRKISEAALVGTDDSGEWARRVPASCTCLQDALDWLEPVAIKNARKKGKKIVRQGDCYAVETSRQISVGECVFSRRHTATAQFYGVTLCHPEHNPVYLEGRGWRFVGQRELATGRNGARGRD